MNEVKLCRLFLDDPKIDPKTNNRIKFGSATYLYYIDICKKQGYYLQNNKRPFYTGIKELDIKILSSIKTKILRALCLTDKYINSICPDVWRNKIEMRYPGFPKINDYDPKQLYEKIKDSYESIINVFSNHPDQKIVENWFTEKNNYINYLIEIKSLKSVEEYLKIGARPNQRIINNYLMKWVNYNNVKMIKLLAEYNIFPSQKYVNFAAEKGFYDLFLVLFIYDIFPEQKIINELTEKNYDYDDWYDKKRLDIIGTLASGGIFPDQKSVNIAYEKRNFALLGVLEYYNIIPDQISEDSEDYSLLL